MVASMSLPQDKRTSVRTNVWLCSVVQLIEPECVREIVPCSGGKGENLNSIEIVMYFEIVPYQKVTN